ncbi:hypothetical protein L1987_47112 [Smallanthus sonchifolius]|uniref:Uncharacterized protein n=1 Tax=Smallanthus sonchifolius TaxID=185202 RepID=A0ACB9G3E1_9ASTR|nr:hypothetical protein L1987_47112 [Smallanthus sonchifolius]
MGEYTGSTNTPGFEISLDDDDDDIHAEQEPPSRPMGRDKVKSMGRDKAKAKGNVMSSSDYEAKKLSLIEELAETNRVKKQAIEQFDQKFDKFYELEQRKIMLAWHFPLQDISCISFSKPEFTPSWGQRMEVTV